MRAEVPDVPLDESIPTRFWNVTDAEAMRSVVDAVVAVTIVVEAYRNVEAVEVVAVKYAPTTCPTTESFA